MWDFGYLYMRVGVGLGYLFLSSLLASSFFLALFFN